jgi:uncharacterized membrane protein YeaQ/YmgE (transglycosylase-associated protein family)
VADAQLPQIAQQWANDVLVWVGFGTLAGLLAKAIMPGRDPGGTVVTLLLGICGSVIGSGVMMYFWESGRVAMVSPLGFLVAVAGAFVLLFFYRLLSGTLTRRQPQYVTDVNDDEYDLITHLPRRRRRRRARISQLDDI